MPGKQVKLFLALMSIAAVGCGDPAAKAPVGAHVTKAPVLVTNYPLQYFAQRIAGDLIDVQFPMREDGDPAFWQPNPQVIALYQTADTILINGASYEKWIANATLPESRIVDTSAGFRDQFIVIEAAQTHSHGPEGEHSHSGTAFTTWVDFRQAQSQSEAILQALKLSLPDEQAPLTQGLSRLTEDLQALDQQMTDIGRRLEGRPLIASHPVYDYLARRYGLNLRSVLWEPEVVPTQTQWDELRSILDQHPANAMLWEGVPAPESVAQLKEMGIESVVFDPCGNVPEEGDWLSVMRQNVENLSEWEQTHPVESASSAADRP